MNTYKAVQEELEADVQLRQRLEAEEKQELQEEKMNDVTIIKEPVYQHYGQELENTVGEPIDAIDGTRFSVVKCTRTESMGAFGTSTHDEFYVQIRRNAAHVTFRVAKQDADRVLREVAVAYAHQYGQRMSAKYADVLNAVGGQNANT